MTDLIDRQAAKEWIIPDADLGCDGAYFDYQELVRCKDCVFSEGFGWSACPMLGIVKLKDDDFCSRGERRTDDCN